MVNVEGMFLVCVRKTLVLTPYDVHMYICTCARDSMYVCMYKHTVAVFPIYRCMYICMGGDQCQSLISWKMLRKCDRS